jgi:hypothetical protein
LDFSKPDKHENRKIPTPSWSLVQKVEYNLLNRLRNTLDFKMNRKRIIVVIATAMLLVGATWLWIALPEIIHRFNTDSTTGFHKAFTKPRTKRQAARAYIRGKLMILESLKRDGTLRYPTPEEWKKGMSGVPPDRWTDPWGKPYKYHLVDGKPKLSSAGRDQVFGTRDDVNN